MGLLPVKVLIVCLCLAYTIAFQTASASESVAKVEWLNSSDITSSLEDSQLEIEQSFAFRNGTGRPLAIDRVVVSCGCTAPDYTRDVIEPDAEGSVTLRYSTKIPGRGRELTARIFFSDGESSVLRWMVKDSPNPSSTPVVSSAPPLVPLLQWKPGDMPVKSLEFPMEKDSRVSKMTGTDKIEIVEEKYYPSTRNLALHFRKMTELPFWGAIMIEFEDPSIPPLRVNVRSLK
jgi:hypothetical protein